MPDFSSTIDSNKIIVPFEFKMENLEHLTNILDELKKAAADIPDTAKAGMEISRKGGVPVPPTTAKAKKADQKMDEADKARDALLTQEEDEMMEDLMNEVAPDSIKKKVESALKNMDVGVASEGLSMLKNPKGFIIGLMTNPAVAAALIAAGYLTFMLEISMMQSGALDKHFRRIVTNEIIKSVRPLQRRMTQVGLGRQVIFTSESGSTQPQLAFNSYGVLRRGEIDQVDSFQIRKGYKW